MKLGLALAAAGYDAAFVDLAFRTRSADEALDVAAQVIERCGAPARRRAERPASPVVGGVP